MADREGAREVLAGLRAFGRMRLAQSQRAIDAARIEAPHLVDALAEAHERLGAEVRAAVLHAVTWVHWRNIRDAKQVATERNEKTP